MGAFWCCSPDHQEGGTPAAKAKGKGQAKGKGKAKGKAPPDAAEHAEENEAQVGGPEKGLGRLAVRIRVPDGLCAA